MRLECYTSIEDMPVYNWHKVHETGSLEYLFKSRRQLKSREFKVMNELWKNIYEEYVRVFGWSPKFIEIAKKQKKIDLLKIEKILTGDRLLNTFIRIEELELQALIEGNKSQGFYESKSMLEAALGFSIDVHKCTVAEYYAHFDTMKKKHKAIEQSRSTGNGKR